MNPISRQDFAEIVRRAAQRDTSYDPNGWSDENPLWGHCAVVSLLAQDYFGGSLVRGSLAHLPEYAHLKSHYWNKFPNGEEIDFTKEQYKKAIFTDLTHEDRMRDSVLDHPDTAKRYDLLKNRFNQLLSKT